MYCLGYALTHRRLFRINTELLTIERKEGIQRWSKDSDVYLDLKRVEEEKEKQKVLESMATCARERWFLLNLKAKFAGILYPNCIHEKS